MAKVFLSAGHGGSDPGAVGFGLKEKDINLQTLLACKEVLEDHGLQVICSRIRDENDPVGQEVKEANASGADLAVSFHNNAGGGDGFEAFINPKNANASKLAKMAEKQIKALGQNSRGIKSGMKLYFVKNTKATAVLFESFFVDNANDKQIGDTIAEQKAFGVAYAKAILEYYGIAYKGAGATATKGPETAAKPAKAETAADPGAYKVKITASSLNVRSGAGTQYGITGVITDNEKLIRSNPGHYFPKTIYTITEEKAGWGKLKSGIGWISLRYTEKA